MVDFTDGWNFIEWGAIAAAFTAILTAASYIYTKGIKPVVKASKEFNKRWGDAGEIDEMQEQLATILEVLTPSNGDSRTLSDRLDDIGHKAVEAITVSHETRRMLVEYQRDELIERRARQREVQEERRELNRRLGTLETRQNDISKRQTRTEQKIDEVLTKLESPHG